MLKSTFRHLRGVGQKSEHNLWRSGVVSWEQYLSSSYRQLDMFSGVPLPDSVQSSINAYNKRDVRYFADLLPKSEYYRLALAYPGDVLFLDIETTGLSIYYDRITLVGWSSGQSYGFYVAGEDDANLRQALNDANIIVTFNGTMFDLKFLEKEFPNIIMPPVHLDLRYFARRAGFSGGQKYIEKKIGFTRPEALEEMEGESAPVLWHQYRRGSIEALKKLIEYNHSDVEGMKKILHVSINEVFENESIPESVRVSSPFSDMVSEIRWNGNALESSDGDPVYIKEYQGKVTPDITYDDLEKLVNLNDLCIVGIDLVSSEERESGVCVLRGNVAETFRVKSDSELISVVSAYKADIVSIDSPLSIPKGRTTYFDDDPNRNEYGITRVCERILKKRGVNVYPCLIQSMQKLTERGMSLANKIRDKGVPVIESYPGAAQDIMRIPRKQAGLKYLSQGLSEFGISGEFQRCMVSHDELDAITSSVVGLFFWSGMYEALGDKEEGYLIIPSIQVNPELLPERLVVGLSGRTASGKTLISEMFESYGYKSVRYSEVISEILERSNYGKVNRKVLHECGKKINKELGQRWLGAKVVEKIENDRRSVVDGVRFNQDVAYFRELFGPRYVHIHVRAPEEFRRNYFNERRDHDLEFEEVSQSITESEVDTLDLLADFVLDNSEGKSELESKLKDILGGLECR